MMRRPILLLPVVALLFLTLGLLCACRQSPSAARAPHGSDPCGPVMTDPVYDVGCGGGNLGIGGGGRGAFTTPR